jgi:hypothetical protein
VPARQVYSTNFVNIHSVLGTTTYDVPAGYRAVLRAMSLWVPFGTPNLHASVITVALDNLNCFVWDVYGNTVSGGVFQWEGREVFGTFLNAIGWGEPYSFRASGYLLATP